MALYDDFLVLQCQQGDRDALGRLVDRWQERLFRHARRLAGNDNTAWDVVQETWIAVIDGISRLQNVESFPQWVFRIMSNRYGDLQRKEHRRRTAGRDLAINPVRHAGPRSAPEPWPDLISDAIKTLPPEQRSAVALYYLEGFGIAEVAQIESVPQGTVKSRLYHARNTLRRYLEEAQDG